MNKSLLSIAAASMLLAGVGFASAQEGASSPPEWKPNHGTMMMEYSTTKKYSSFMDPNLTPAVGTELPGTVTLYDLPDTMNIPASTRYRYGMVNNRPVVVETTTRKVVHTWQ